MFFKCWYALSKHFFQVVDKVYHRLETMGRTLILFLRKAQEARQKKTVQTSDKDETFLEIEIKEKMARESKNPKQSRQNERAALKGAIENLPYTEFQGLLNENCIAVYANQYAL